MLEQGPEDASEFDRQKKAGGVHIQWKVSRSNKRNNYVIAVPLTTI